MKCLTKNVQKQTGITLTGTGICFISTGLGLTGLYILMNIELYMGNVSDFASKANQSRSIILCLYVHHSSAVCMYLGTSSL